MKRFALFAAIAAVIFAPNAHAQNHGEVGAFVDYFRLHETRANYVGLGARAGFNVAKPIQLEAEMAYDFSRAYTETFNKTSGVNTQNSNIKVLHGLFGPKLQTTGPVRVFVTAKGGFTNFRFDTSANSFSNVLWLQVSPLASRRASILRKSQLALSTVTRGITPLASSVIAGETNKWLVIKPQEATINASKLRSAQRSPILG